MAQALLVCLGVSLLVCVVLIYSAWDTLEPWEIGLDYNTILQSISPDAWSTGRHWLGLGHRFVKFPSTVITVQFSHEAGAGTSGGPLRSRTYDGLEVSLEISFQYQLAKDSLYQMYTTFGPEYHNLFVKMGMDLLTVAATHHYARAFFVNRTMIGDRMEQSLRKHFREQAYVDVPLFQFQAVSLLGDFESAIKETQAQQKMRKVEFETEVIQAQRYVQVRSQQATAMAESIALKNSAAIQSLNATQLCAAAAFEKVLDIFGGDSNKMLKYMKVRAMRDHPAENSVLGIRDDIDILNDPID